MKQDKTSIKTLAVPDARMAVKFVSLAAVATFLPFFIHLQWVTGPIVNAILIITLFLIGIRSAFVIALIPSVVALGSGLLPAPLAPMIPFIMMGNVILVLAVDWFSRNIKNAEKGYWMGVGMGALLKFALLYYSADIVIGLLLKQQLAVKVAQMMSWPQFATAVAGGVLAWGFLRSFRIFKRA